MMVWRRLERLVRLFCFDPVYFFRAALRHLRRHLPIDRYFFRDGRAFFPEVIEIEVTHACNLRCVMCDLYGGDGIDSVRSRRISTEELLAPLEFRRFVDDVAPAKPAISFTGGEPLIRPEIVEMISYVKSRGLVATLTTNGTLLAERAADLVTASLDNIVVSLDGPEEVHDAVRGRPSTYALAVRGIRRVIAERDARKLIKPRVGINATISGMTFKTIDRLPQIAESLGVDRIVFSHLWHWTDSMVAEQNRSYGDIAKSAVQNIRGLEGLDVEILIEKIDALRRSHAQCAIEFLPDISPAEIRLFYGHSDRFIKNRCLYPWIASMVMPDGEVIACMDYHIGNIRKTRFTELWNGQRYRSFRKLMRQKGVLPACARCCGLFIF